MKSISNTQANVHSKDTVADEISQEIRFEDEIPAKETLGSKLETFEKHLTTAQKDWIEQLKAVDWNTEDVRNRAWHFFAEAHIIGIRHSVAYPLVKCVLEQHGVQIAPKELSSLAFGAYKGGANQVSPANNQRRAPKPTIYPGMVIAKAKVSNG